MSLRNQKRQISLLLPPPPPHLTSPGDYNNPPLRKRGLACHKAPGSYRDSGQTRRQRDGRRSASDPAETQGAVSSGSPKLALSRLGPGGAKLPDGPPSNPRALGASSGTPRAAPSRRAPSPPGSNALPREPSPAQAFPRCDSLVHPGDSDFRLSAEAESLIPSRPAHPPPG